MESQIEISIPRTETKDSGTLFSSSFTVPFIQVYEIHIKKPNHFETSAFKRYSELHFIYHTVRSTQLHPAIVKERLNLPEFPKKKINKMNEKTILKRKRDLEKWLQEAVLCKAISENLLKMLGVGSEVIAREIGAKPNYDEQQIATFVERVNSSLNEKMKIIESFNWNFFEKKRTIGQESIYRLVECLIPLCGSEFFGNKALDILSKLTTYDHFKDCAIVSRVFTSFPTDTLRLINLHEYLLRIRFSECQLQAYKLCKIIEDGLGAENLYAILNNNQAISIFNNWGKQSLSEMPRSLSTNIQEWRPLVQDKYLNFKFRFVNRVLEVSGELFVECSVSRTADLLTIPEERKKWDLKLVDMIQIPNTDSFTFFYTSDRALYEFQTEVRKTESESTTSIEFRSNCYESKKKGSILGTFSSSYFIELIEDQPSSTKESEEVFVLTNPKTRIEWNSRFCENSLGLLRGDLFQEDDMLKKSFMNFIAVAENKAKAVKTTAEDSMTHVYERKRLSRALTFTNFDRVLNSQKDEIYK